MKTLYIIFIMAGVVLLESSSFPYHAAGARDIVSAVHVFTVIFITVLLPARMALYSGTAVKNDLGTVSVRVLEWIVLIAAVYAFSFFQGETTGRLLLLSFLAAMIYLLPALVYSLAYAGRGAFVAVYYSAVFLLLVIPLQMYYVVSENYGKYPAEILLKISPLTAWSHGITVLALHLAFSLLLSFAPLALVRNNAGKNKI